MRKLAKPTKTVKDVFELCIDTQIKRETQDLLKGLLRDVEAAETAYEAAARIGQLYTLRATYSELAEEAVKVYENRFRPKKSAGRAIYDELLLSSPNRLCPFCGVGYVDSLDHYLPKRPFWAMAVMPVNLVPSCDHCNGAKLMLVPTTPERQIIHPYYDDFDDEIWLVATITETNPVGVVFTVDEVVNWDQQRNVRVRNHFSELELAELFTAQAGTELSGDKQRYIDLYAQVGPAGVLEFVSDELHYAETRPFMNDWKTALYRALSKSEWFLEEGCLLIG